MDEMDRQQAIEDSVMNRIVVITAIGKRVKTGNGRLGVVIKQVGRGSQSKFEVELEDGSGRITISGWYLTILPREHQYGCE